MFNHIRFAFGFSLPLLLAAAVGLGEEYPMFSFAPRVARSAGEVESPAPSFTDIFNAAVYGTVDDVRIFVEQGANVNAKPYDRSLLHCAASNPNVDVLKYLVSQGADVHAKTDRGETALHIAANGASRVEVLEYLISQGLDVHAKTDAGETPLHIVSQSSTDVDVLKYLIEQGADIADIDLKETIRSLAFYFIKSRGKDIDTEFVITLISRSADFIAKGDSGWTLLHIAVLENIDAKVVKALIEHGSNVNAKLESGQTPLHFAMQRATPNIDVVKILIEHGADVNAKTSNDFTPLHYAVAHRDTDTVKILIEHGADVNAKTDWGATPRDQINFPFVSAEEIDTLLREAGGERSGPDAEVWKNWPTLPVGNVNNVNYQ